MVITAKHDRANKDVLQLLQEALNTNKYYALFRTYQEFVTWDIWPDKKYINFKILAMTLRMTAMLSLSTIDGVDNQVQ